ncbi:MAG: helix-turn-helix transcriptional regulator [Eubacteriales bacterium]|nr:helix-turn-helix transcriptional regulator [Eubacteriales bacterium]
MMVLNELMNQKNITKYRLSKKSGVPYTTVNDICSGKAQLEKCSAETIYKIAKELEVPMELLLEPYIARRSSFELYKSNVCHKVKELGDVGFIIELLESNEIRRKYEKKWYRESLYLLAMLDYLSRLNQVPLCTDYDDLRGCKLDTIIYPASVLAAAAVTGDEKIKEDSCRESIPEFMRFNIVESEVRNVV